MISRYLSLIVFISFFHIWEIAEIIRDNYSIECDIDNNKKQTNLKSKRQGQNKFDE